MIRAQSVRQLETEFVRDINRYRWVTGINVDQTWDNWNVYLNNQFTSDAFILFSDRLSFRDEDQLLFGLTRTLSKKLEGRITGRAAWFSQSSVLNQDVYGGLRFKSAAGFWAEPMIGFSWDQRPGIAIDEQTDPLRTDAGPAYGWRLSLLPESIGGYNFMLETDAVWQMINPRRGRAFHLTSGIERAFEETVLRMSVSGSSLRRDAYQAVSFLNRDVPTDRLSETVEATTSDTLVATASIDTPLYRKLRFTSQVEFAVNNRYVRTYGAPESSLFFDTDFNRREVDSEFGLLYESDRLSTRIAARIGAELEQRKLDNRDELPAIQASQKTLILQQADYDRGHFALVTSTKAALTSRLTLLVDGTASILRHDTPETNLDDRDEVYHTGLIGLQYVFSRYFQSDIRWSGTYYHTVYIDATRSAENSVQRSLRMRPNVQWTPDIKTRVRLSSEVRATYTVDDFVLPGRKAKDQSARELRYDLNVDRSFGSGLRVFGEGSYSSLFLGRLLWNDFAEIPSDTLRTYSGWLRVQAGRRIVAEVGMRFFIRSDYDRSVTVYYPRVDANGNPVLDETGNPINSNITLPGRVRIEQIGPTCMLSWPMQRNSRIRLDGWFNVQHVRQRLYGSLPEASADRIRKAAHRGTRLILPNLSLSVVWNL